MKTSVVFALLLLLTGRVVAQAPQSAAPATQAAPALSSLPDIEKEVNPVTGEILGATVDHPKFVTNNTFNHFAAKHQAYYLSGLSNLSLFKNFAIADVTGGTLQVGNNFTFRGENDLIKGVVTIAVQSNIANNVANLLSKGKLANDLGIPLSYTLFIRPTSAIDNADANELSGKRAFQYALLRRKMAFELQQINSINISSGTSIARDSIEKQAAKDVLVKKATTDFYDAELTALETEIPKFYTFWARAQGFVPISNSTYQVAPAGSLSFQEESMRKWSAGITLGGIWESNWTWGTLFGNISARVISTNAVEQKADKIKGYTQYDLLNAQAQPAKLYYDGDGTKVYVGDLGNTWAVPVQYQLVYFPPFKGATKVGVDVQLERYSFNYSKTNLLLGIPVFLQGKEDKGLNVEVQFKLRDIDKGDVSGSDRFTVGLSVAIPFGSIVK